MSYIIRDENGGERVIAPLGGDTLIAHVNADGTAHDYREPGHINFHVPGGVYNPHGVRGSTTYEDGRAKYSKEELLRGIRDGRINRNYLSDDDRFWPQNTRPGDGSSMTPEAQKLYDSIFKEPVPQDDTSSVGELSFLNSFIDGQQIAGYDPELDQYMYDEHGSVVGTPSQEFLDRPKIFGSDVLDMLIKNEQVKNLSRSNNGLA